MHIQFKGGRLLTVTILLAILKFTNILSFSWFIVLLPILSPLIIIVYLFLFSNIFKLG